MAERRMISKNIIDSDAFLDMPASSQNLYFHLNIRADDEGFIDGPKKVMRTIGANQNDLEILLAKRYLLSFDSGVIVIKHWKLHNLIRKDRMKDTMYTEEKEQLFHKADGSYTDHDNHMTTKCQRSIGEVSIEKDSREDDPAESSFDEFWNAYDKKTDHKKAKAKYISLYKKGLIPDNLIEVVKKWKNTDSWKKNNGMYQPLATTWLNGERWEDELTSLPEQSTYVDRERNVPKDEHCSVCGHKTVKGFCTNCGDDDPNYKRGEL